MGALSSFAGSTQFSLVGSTSAITGIASYFQSVAATPQVIATDMYNLCNVTGRTFIPLLPSLINAPTAFSQRSLVLAGSSAGAGVLFGCGAGDFWRTQGTTATSWQFSLGKPTRTSVAFGAALGGAMSGPLVMYYSLARSDGFWGPARAITYSLTGSSFVSFTIPNNPNIQIGSTGGGGIYIGTSVALSSFGLSGIQIWAQINSGPIYQYGDLVPLGTVGFTLSFGFTGASFFIPGSSYQPSGVQYRLPQDFQGAFIYGLGSTQGGLDATVSSAADGDNPQCIEYHYDRLFSAIGSRVIYSNPGTPEEADYENFFFVAQNQPLDITTMKSYFTQLLLWKFDSTWSLSGTSPDTFVLTQSTPIYGCISKNGACVWEQKCWFLDAKGICEFNGANTAIVSNKVESYFKLMNVQAAAKTAIMVHVKERNEVWCAIPISGSEKNNLLVVYDYLSNAWTTRTIANDDLTFLASLTLGNTKPVIYNGTSAGMINYYGSSMVGDNGVGFTSIIKSRFVTQFGNSVEAMYRRLYLDVSVPPGTTQNFLINLYADKGASPYYSVTMSVSSFQNRIDFGVPARSMAVEFIYSTNSFMQLNGFTIESRFQRNV